MRIYSASALTTNSKRDNILDITASYLRASVAPVASQIDTDPEALKQAIMRICDRNLLVLQIPKA